MTISQGQRDKFGGEMKVSGRLLTALFVGCMTTPLVVADTIASATAGTSTSGSAYVGQGFTTLSSGGPWDDITFNFYSATDATNPEASGTAYLLSQEYTGTPAALSSSTPGYLDSTSTISGGEYIFDSSLTLQANTQYWLYEDAAMTVSGGPINSGTVYFASGSASNFGSFANRPISW